MTLKAVSQYVMKHIMLPITIGTVLGWIFYRSLISMILLALLLMLYGQFQKKEENTKLKLLNFKAFLNGIYTELLVGQSFRNAVKVSQQTMGEESKLFRMSIDQLIIETSIGTSEVRAWQNFARQINLKMCDQFVLILEATYNHGGQISKVLKHTIRSISDQIDLELELGVMLSAKKLEFYLMMVIPIVMIGFLSVSNAEYMSILYTTLIGRIVMTTVLLSMTVSYFIGVNIIKIEV